MAQKKNVYNVWQIYILEHRSFTFVQ